VGVLIRLGVAALAIVLAASCAGSPPTTEVYRAAARGACGDAELAKKELIAMRRKLVTRRAAATVLAATARRIDERAETLGDGRSRLHDLAASLRVMRATIVGRGDEGVASADARVTRAEVGCVSAAR
jgi:hypothetical protein